MTPLLPPADFESFFYCTFVLYREDGRPHRCDRRAVAVYEGPLGRLPRCRVHERPAQADPEYRVVSA